MPLIQRSTHCVLVTALACSVFAAVAQTTQQGNRLAESIASRSPMIQSAKRVLIESAARIKEPALKAATLDAIQNPSTCVVHRAGLSDQQKDAIVAKLIVERLVDPADDRDFPGGLKNGVFPPLRNDGSTCPQLPLSFFAAPGSEKDHHTYPGGLAIHESLVLLAAQQLGETYRRVYATANAEGFPVVRPFSQTGDNQTKGLIDEDILIAASIWHDWPKTFVNQWNDDGTITRELFFGGNGKTDNLEHPGSSKTQGHHILALAELMKRNLPPALIVTVAAAHSVPMEGADFRVVNWLRTAAIVAQVDPVHIGVLYRDNEGRLRVPPLRVPVNRDITASGGEIHVLAEYTIEHLADADYTFTNHAHSEVDMLLACVAPEFGFDPADRPTYNNHFRNPALSWLTSEHLALIYANKGLAGVKEELRLLRKHKVI